MTVRDALQQGVSELRESTETPYLDAMVLLGYVSHRRTEQVIASFPDEVGPDDLLSFRKCIERRRMGQPVAYIRGVKEFYGIEFHVDSRALIPRPESELLVDLAIELVDGDPSLRRVHDCCTGSGCVAIALKHERPGLAISASDVSQTALDVFRINSSRILGEILPVYESNLLCSVPGTYGLIIANPPYLSIAEVNSLSAKGWPEPRSALEGGALGSEITERLVSESVRSLSPGGHLVVETAATLAGRLAEKFVQCGFSNTRITVDLAGRQRIVSGTWTA